MNYTQNEGDEYTSSAMTTLRIITGMIALEGPKWIAELRNSPLIKPEIAMTAVVIGFENQILGVNERDGKIRLDTVPFDWLLDVQWIEESGFGMGGLTPTDLAVEVITDWMHVLNDSNPDKILLPKDIWAGPNAPCSLFLWPSVLSNLRQSEVLFSLSSTLLSWHNHPAYSAGNSSQEVVA